MIGGAGPVWLAGCGAMAGAMLSRWLEAGLEPDRVTVIRPSGKPAPGGVRVLTAPPADGPPPALLMLGMKPRTLDEAAPALASVAGGATVLVSILAGVEIVSLARRFPKARAIVRAMPNTPVALGHGVVGLAAADDLDPAVRRSVDALMAPLGLVEWVEDGAMDAVAALAGSGPAFLFRFLDALARAGAADGIDEAVAARLALATVEGAALLAARAEAPPEELARRVASPGGSTQAGLDILDRDGALVGLLEATLAAARRRNAEMAAAAR